MVRSGNEASFAWLYTLTGLGEPESEMHFKCCSGNQMGEGRRVSTDEA